MKPTKLIISAFGPYAGLMPEIDFEQFEQKGLFLVTGETGSGKTMIFDAICYALFGTASGQWRDVKNLRSDYADEGTETFVDFHFSHQGKNYHVWRRPSYTRKAKRGKGETEEKAAARLYQDGILIEDGLTQVNKAIEELLHITEKQFKQIAMIAQGEFREMLNAKTEDRTKILRKIFLTDGYEKLTMKLKARMDSAQKAKDRAADSIAQHFSDVTAQEDSVLYAEVLRLRERTKGSSESWTAEQLIELTDRISAEDSIILEEKKVLLQAANSALQMSLDRRSKAEQNNKALKKLEELKKEHEELTARTAEMDALEANLSRQKTATRELSPTDKAWQRKCAEVQESENKIEAQEKLIALSLERSEAAEKALCEAKTGKPEADSLKIKVSKLAEEEPKYTERDELLKTQAVNGKMQAALIKQEEQLKADEENLKARIEELTHTAGVLKNSPVLLAEEKSTQEKLAALRGRLDTIADKTLPAYEKAGTELAEKQKSFIDARQAYESASAVRQEAERILENCRAGILALNLEDGRKCPVCGSLHHPEPASLPPESVSEEEVKQLRNKEDKKQKAKTEAYTAAEKAKTGLDSIEKQLCEAITSCLADPALSIKAADNTAALTASVKPAHARIVELIKDADEKIVTLQKDCAKLKSAEDELAKAQSTYSDALAVRRSKLASDKAELEKKIAQTNTRLDALSGLSFDSLAEAKAEKARAENRAREILKAIEDAENAKLEANNTLTAARSTLEEQKSTLCAQKKAADELWVQLDTALSKHGFGSPEEMRGFTLTEEAIAIEEQRINEHRQALAANEKMLSDSVKETEGMIAADIEELNGICAGHETARDALSAEVNSISNRIAINTQKREAIAGQTDELARARKEYKISRHLYELVRGTTGNGKVTLEQYIQAARFDSIIDAANRRLDPMSGGQFQLKRQNGNHSLQSSNFLDLEVLDSWTGRSRPVGNISGGESFKASLSLALGLADTVSMNQGGVQLDALFVDEGFGTLDAKSIDSAMDILTSLSQKNRVVGIISHREELKAAISNKIVVSKSRTGSSIGIDIDN